MTDLQFEVTPALGATYGPRIFIRCVEEEIDKEVVEKLNALCAFGGNTSSMPDQYSMWEFFNHDKIIEASLFLTDNGWRLK